MKDSGGPLELWSLIKYFLKLADSALSVWSLHLKSIFASLIISQACNNVGDYLDSRKLKQKLSKRIRVQDMKLDLCNAIQTIISNAIGYSRLSFSHGASTESYSVLLTMGQFLTKGGKKSEGHEEH